MMIMERGGFCVSVKLFECFELIIIEFELFLFEDLEYRVYFLVVMMNFL